MSTTTTTTTAGQKRTLGTPSLDYMFCFSCTEMWERFSYYGMRAHFGSLFNLLALQL